MSEKKPLALYNGVAGELQSGDFLSSDPRPLEVPPGATKTIPAGSQVIVYRKYKVSGTLKLDGELIIL